jgi:hypothetical protein
MHLRCLFPNAYFSPANKINFANPKKVRIFAVAYYIYCAGYLCYIHAMGKIDRAALRQRIQTLEVDGCVKKYWRMPK